MDVKCSICGDELLSSEVDTVKEKGRQTLIASSEKRKDGKADIFRTVKQILIHQKCRKLYTNEKSINAYVKKTEKKTLVKPPTENYSSFHPSEQFDFKTKCMFCAQEITKEFLINESKKPRGRRIEISNVRSNTNINTGITKAAEKMNDDWSREVTSRIRGVDLVGEGARYHRPCYGKFCRPRASGKPSGRPLDESIKSSMERIFNYLEENKDDCEFSLSELRDVVDDDPPTNVTIKKKLVEKYGDDIVITSHVGRTPIISFRNNEVLDNSRNQEKQQDEETEPMRKKLCQ